MPTALAYAYDASGQRDPLYALASGAETSASLCHANIVLARENLARVRAGDADALDALDDRLARAEAAVDGWPRFLERMAKSLRGRLTRWLPSEDAPTLQLRLLDEDS